MSYGFAFPVLANAARKPGSPAVKLEVCPALPQSTIAFSVNGMIGPPQ